MRNEIKLYTNIGGELVSHFTLREFENKDGLCMVHPTTLESLERTRADLCEMYAGEVSVIITCGIRTDAEQAALARVLGWTDQGGAVARDSRHRVKYGGIAVDCKAVVRATGKRVPQRTLGRICSKYFDYVKDNYSDGHVHADNRVKGATK